MGNVQQQIQQQILHCMDDPTMQYEEQNAELRRTKRASRSRAINEKKEEKQQEKQLDLYPTHQNYSSLSESNLPFVSYVEYEKNRDSVTKLKVKHKSRKSISVTNWIPDDIFRIKSSEKSIDYTLDDIQIDIKELLVIGQGTLELRQGIPSSFTITIYNDEDGQQENNVKLKVDCNAASITFFNYKKGENILCQTQETNKILQTKGNGACNYWFSISDNNKFIKYGIGELREKTKQLEYNFTEKDDCDLYTFLNIANSAELTVYGDDYAWRIHRYCVVYEAPTLIIDNNQITMNHIHNGQYTVAQNLPYVCTQLYYNVYGHNFILDTKDFPYFTQTIEESIGDPNGWCFNKLKEKASGFGHHDPKGTYLRITLGRNHCNSPGVPFVMEIWPCGHYSPIHNHANAHAIIRVLYGEIIISLYPFLSPFYREPHTVQLFKEGDITYITNGLNAIHKLRNPSKYKTCITIQCYQYGDDDKGHYEYFDYINDESNVVQQFDPTSDLPFGQFKETMKREHQKRHPDAY